MHYPQNNLKTASGDGWRKDDPITTVRTIRRLFSLRVGFLIFDHAQSLRWRLRDISGRSQASAQPRGGAHGEIDMRTSRTRSCGTLRRKANNMAIFGYEYIPIRHHMTSQRSGARACATGDIQRLACWHVSGFPTAGCLELWFRFCRTVLSIEMCKIGLLVSALFENELSARTCFPSDIAKQLPGDVL